MSTPLNVGDILEVKVFCMQGDQLGINVQHFDVVSLTGVPSLEATATDMETNLSVYYSNVLVEHARFRGITLAVVAPSPIAGVIRNAHAIDGLVSGDALPKQCAGIVSLRTATVGRTGRGRIYVPFPAEASCGADGQPLASYRTDLSIIGDYFVNDQLIDQGSGDTVTIHGSVYHRITTTSTLYAGYVIPIKFATQRKRGDYGRINTPPF